MDTLGLCVLGVELLLSVLVIHFAVKGRLHWGLVIACLGLGLLIGGFAVLYTRPLDASTRVGGFPFRWSFFKEEDGRWVDYFADDTGLRMLGNFMVGLLLPLVPLFIFGLFRKPRGSSKDTGS